MPRFIPAGAGNTIPAFLTLFEIPVYPRWRGEHIPSSISITSRRGLSPLARGTQLKLSKSEADLRFIPAGAGNTLNTIRPPLKSTVYPRWRGEHPHPTDGDIPWRGLSPLARGTPDLIYSTRIRFRFIPAGAGNTRTKTHAGPRFTVYPRWRGEHCIRHLHRRQSGGLSPLARGTLRACALGSYWTRFIPAGAGNTKAARSQRRMTTVYPRWRGEHEAQVGSGGATNGLSPLARGTH